MDIFKLVGSIFIDTDKANDSLQKTDKKASDVGATLGKIGGTAAKVGTAVVAGATAMVGGMVSMAKQSATTADEVDKASIRMGISAESYQEYAYAAGLAGVETSTLESAAKKLEGTDINFDDAINSIMSFETAEERSAAAAELFGDKIAYQLSPLIEQSADDFNAAKQEANDLGLVMSNDLVKSGAAMNDTFSKIEQSGQMLFTSLGGALMPLVQTFADKILEYMPMIQGFIEQLIPIVTKMFEELVPPLMDLIDQIMPILFDLISALLPVITEIITSILPVVVELLQAFLPPIMQLVQALLPVVLDLINALLPILAPIIELLTPILELVVALLEPFLSMIDVILPPLIKLLVFFVDVALQPLQVILNVVSEAAQKFSETFVAALQYIKDKSKAPINAILGFMNSMVSGAVTAVNGIIRAINRVHIDVPAWLQKITGMQTFGFNIAELSAPQIPLLAKGGEIDSGAAIVGEDGPELLQTNGSRTRVTPLNDNNNAFVGLEQKLDRMIELLEDGFGVYLNNGAVVGQLGPDMATELGRLSIKNNRRVL